MMRRPSNYLGGVADARARQCKHVRRRRALLGPRLNHTAKETATKAQRPGLFFHSASARRRAFGKHADAWSFLLSLASNPPPPSSILQRPSPGLHARAELWRPFFLFVFFQCFFLFLVGRPRSSFVFEESRCCSARRFRETLAARTFLRRADVPRFPLPPRCPFPVRETERKDVRYGLILHAPRWRCH